MTAQNTNRTEAWFHFMDGLVGDDLDLCEKRLSLPELGIRFSDGQNHAEIAAQLMPEQYHAAIHEAAELWPQLRAAKAEFDEMGERIQAMRQHHDGLLSIIEDYETRIYRSMTPYQRRRKNRNASQEHYTKAEWAALKSFYRYTCLACGRQEPDIKLHPDHVKPLACGGDDSIRNIQPLCEHDNIRKGATIIDYRCDVSAAVLSRS